MINKYSVTFLCIGLWNVSLCLSLSRTIASEEPEEGPWPVFVVPAQADEVTAEHCSNTKVSPVLKFVLRDERTVTISGSADDCEWLQAVGGLSLSWCLPALLWLLHRLNLLFGSNSAELFVFTKLSHPFVYCFTKWVSSWTDISSLWCEDKAKATMCVCSGSRVEADFCYFNLKLHN